MRTLYFLAIVVLATAVICDGRPGRASGRRRGSSRRSERPVVKLEDCFDKEKIQEEVKNIKDCNKENGDERRRGRGRSNRRHGRDVAAIDVDDVVVEEEGSDDDEIDRNGDRRARRQWARGNKKLGRNIRCLITHSDDPNPDGKLELSSIKTKMEALAKTEKRDALSEAFDECSEGKTEVKGKHEMKALVKCIWKAGATKICPYKQD